MSAGHSTANMAAEVTGPLGSRTIAIPPGVTPAEAVAWVTPYLGKGEVITGMVIYK